MNGTMRMWLGWSVSIMAFVVVGCSDAAEGTSIVCGTTSCRGANAGCVNDSCVTLSGHADVGTLGADLRAKATVTLASSPNPELSVVIAGKATCDSPGETSDLSLTLLYPMSSAGTVQSPTVRASYRPAGAATAELATSVTVTLASASANGSTGSFEADFPTAGHLSGTFDAPACPAP